MSKESTDTNTTQKFRNKFKQKWTKSKWLDYFNNGIWHSPTFSHPLIEWCKTQLYSKLQLLGRGLGSWGIETGQYAEYILK